MVRKVLTAAPPMPCLMPGASAIPDNPYDADGVWAAQGHVHAELLAQMLAEPFIQQAPPKSTGRDFVQRALAGAAASALSRIWRLWMCKPRSRPTPRRPPPYMCNALRQPLRGWWRRVRKRHFMRQLAQALPGVQVLSSQELGVDPQTVEASALPGSACTPCCACPRTCAPSPAHRTHGCWAACIRRKPVTIHLRLG